MVSVAAETAACGCGTELLGKRVTLSGGVAMSIGLLPQRWLQAQFYPYDIDMGILSGYI